MLTFFTESYYYLLALHLIFMVSWFAGLFYVLRLYVYWTEAQILSPVEKKILSRQYAIMSKRLWHIITLPASIITLTFGLGMIAIKWYPTYNLPTWLIVKLVLLALLTGFQYIFYNLHKKMNNNVFKWTSFQLRLWNEVPTIFLFYIIFLAVLKPTTIFAYLICLLMLVFLGILILFFSYRYKKRRLKKEQKSEGKGNDIHA